LQVDTEKPKSGSTSDIRPWYNRKARSHTAKSQVNLANGTTLVIEVKGQDTQEQRAALDEWVRAVNADGRFGRLAWDVAFQPGEVDRIISKF